MKRFISKFKTFIELFGLKFALLKVFKAIIFRITSFRWEKYFLMALVLDEELSAHIDDNIIIKEISIDDYDSNWRGDYIDEKRYLSYIDRLKRDDAVALGAFVDGKLAYSTWVLFDGIEVDGTIYKKKSYGMLWDSYCLPEFRGRGLHNLMNAYSLNLMKDREMIYGSVLILSHNIPAYKTQIHCGLKIEKVFYTYCFLRKKYSTLKF
ncbi:MAG: hypothetical protein IJP59_04885 [Muribaculaceae bacterium]|nr:hypothetical protein [Muribaculaceae bacterium]